MNYFPYFRAKQYELICIRENAELLASEGYTPIIEPVKDQVNSLRRTLTALKEAGAAFLVVANPSVGSHAANLGSDVREAVANALDGYAAGGWLYQVRDDRDVSGLAQWSQHSPSISIFHDGYPSGGHLAAHLQAANLTPTNHIFTTACSKPYRKHFQGGSRILISEGFKKRNNRDYPSIELFSDLVVTYAEEGMTGFGDYLIVGNEYSESGGPAYAVAIHLTFVDPDNDDAVYVQHFVSDRVDTPTDPAGKFKEALAKLVVECTRTDSKIRRTNAVDEFIKLHAMQHFPGLGYVKKLSMQHHLELLAA